MFINLFSISLFDLPYVYYKNLLMESLVSFNDAIVQWQDRTYHSTRFS